MTRSAGIDERSEAITTIFSLSVYRYITIEWFLELEFLKVERSHCIQKLKLTVQIIAFLSRCIYAGWSSVCLSNAWIVR